MSVGKISLAGREEVKEEGVLRTVTRKEGDMKGKRSLDIVC